MKFLRTKLQKDLFLNIIFFGAIVVIGILINIIVLNFYDEEALGIFNQTYAIYIFLSQIAVGGVHLAIQHYIPKYLNNFLMISLLTQSSIILSSFLSIVTVVVSYLCIPIFQMVLNSENVGKALYFSLWGLLFFSINKVLLSILNGLRKMRLFAFFQFLRMFFILAVILILIYFHFQPYYLNSSLAISEVLLSIILLIIHIKYFKKISLSRRWKTIKSLRKFGSKALIGNVLLDLNTKIDVLVLGIFLTDNRVGVYSFVASIFEGFSQLVVLFRNNFNPLFTKVYFNKSMEVTQRIVQITLNSLTNLLIIAGILSIVIYPFAALFIGIKNIWESTFLYLILCLGFILNGKYQIILMIFNQLGKPNLQTFLIFIIAISNTIFNFLLIPFLEVYGAAIGTFLSFFVQRISTKYLMVKYTQINI